MTAEPKVRCWCGAEGLHEDLFSPPSVDRCGGLGTIDCYCGGDFCVCHNHGEIQCPGCDDCDGDDEEWEDEEAGNGR